MNCASRRQVPPVVHPAACARPLGRSGLVDRLVLMVIIIGVVTVFSIILAITSLRSVTAGQDLVRATYERDYIDLLIDSVLLSYDSKTGTSYEALLVQALSTLNTTITVDGNPVRIEDRFSYVLNGTLGPDKYLLNITPIFLGISVSYILDGSPTMRAAREQVQQPLVTLVEELQRLFGPDAKLFFHVYILSDNTHFCDYYEGLSSELREIIKCETLSGESFYDDIMTLLYTPPYEPPYPAPYGSYYDWLAADHFFGAKDFSDSDWASGIIYAALKYDRNELERLSTNGHVIIAVVDELSTGSKADQCFALGSQRQQDPAVCVLCNDECPEQRAERLVDQAKHFLVEKNQRFIGFHTFNRLQKSCNYEYDYGFYSNLPISTYLCRYADSGAIPPCSGWQDCDPTDPLCSPPPAEINFCEQHSCGGCEPAPSGSNYCFHQNCNDIVYKHLEMIADPTGGQVLYLDEMSQLTDIIREYSNSMVRSFNFSVGLQDQGRDRYALQRDLYLPNGKTFNVTLWVYD